MKRTEAISMFNVLSTVKVNKMNDELAEAVLNNHLALHAVQKSLAEAQEALSKRVLDGISEERQRAHAELETKLKATKDAQKQAELQATINDTYADITEANRKFVKVYNKLMDADVEVKLCKVERKAFVKGCADADMQLTPAQLTALAPMFKDVEAAQPADILAEIDALMED